MSYLLELLGQGLQHELGDLLDRYFWSPPRLSIDQLQAAARQHPQRVEIQFQLALVHLRGMQIDQAVDSLRQVCRCKPDFLPARLALAAALAEHNQVEQALEHLQIANQNRPGEKIGRAHV